MSYQRNTNPYCFCGARFGCTTGRLVVHFLFLCSFTLLQTLEGGTIRKIEFKPQDDDDEPIQFSGNTHFTPTDLYIEEPQQALTLRNWEQRRWQLVQFSQSSIPYFRKRDDGFVFFREPHLAAENEFFRRRVVQEEEANQTTTLSGYVPDATRWKLRRVQTTIWRVADLLHYVANENVICGGWSGAALLQGDDLVGIHLGKQEPFYHALSAGLMDGLE
jgi:hypothetical protein